jgi:hypothetical protein
MPRKKREPGGRGPKRRRPEPPPERLPDRRAMEGVLQQLVAGLQGHADQDTPLAKAQALMYPAFEEPDEQRRLRLAKQGNGLRGAGRNMTMELSQAERELRGRFFKAMLEATFPLQTGSDQEMTLQALIRAAEMLKERFEQELDELRQESD